MKFSQFVERIGTQFFRKANSMWKSEMANTFYFTYDNTNTIMDSGKRADGLSFRLPGI